MTAAIFTATIFGKTRRDTKRKQLEDSLDAFVDRTHQTSRKEKGIPAKYRRKEERKRQEWLSPGEEEEERQRKAELNRKIQEERTRA
ncbi:MAG: hypothetical protein U5R30_21640 [Deltaproteobacteria bacterium]|nr:hypothetical protein [Deltaproteobacteria bacterium]